MLVAGIGQCSLDYLAVVDIYPQVDTKNEVLEWYEQGVALLLLHLWHFRAWGYRVGSMGLLAMITQVRQLSSLS